MSEPGPDAAQTGVRVVLYGIPNCDQVRKARAWLDTHRVLHAFHDFKKAGIDRGLIDAWLKDVPWETLLNRKGTTWRGLPEERKAAVTDAEAAALLILESPSIVKRPLLTLGAGVADSTAKSYCGFTPELYQRLFTK
jgi:arsenate reductase